MFRVGDVSPRVGEGEADGRDEGVEPLDAKVLDLAQVNFALSLHLLDDAES